MTVADGLEVTLFASEPMVRNPTDIDIDERGRVWVAEGVNYRASFQKWGTLEPRGDATTVTWAMDGPSPYIAKLMGIFFNMDTMIGKDFETGLANLKAVSEK